MLLAPGTELTYKVLFQSRGKGDLAPRTDLSMLLDEALSAIDEMPDIPKAVAKPSATKPSATKAAKRG